MIYLYTRPIHSAALYTMRVARAVAEGSH